MRTVSPSPSAGLPWPLERVVVVGGSLAGLRACEALRQDGFSGSLVLVGEERHRPYDRPPLSKRFLAGEWDESRLALRRGDPVAALGLDARLGVPAAGLDTDARVVALADGTTVAYDGLIVATGSRPRVLSGASDHPSVHVLRTLDDAVALRAAIVTPGCRLAVIGAGFIGLEVAATARQAGADVVVLEAAPAPLVRGLGADLGAAVAAVHTDRGVDVRCGVSVTGVDALGVHLGGGEVVGVDAVLVGIGAEPATGWLAGSGLTLRDGVVTGPTLAAGPPGVYAAGDIARWPHPRCGEELRIEHWTNAAEQGELAARNLLAAAAGGAPADADAVPFVWSDQYHHRIQLLGRSTTAAGAPAEFEVLVGSLGERRFLAAYHDGGRLRGVLGLDVPRLLMGYRTLVGDGAPLAAAVALAAEQRAGRPARVGG